MGRLTSLLQPEGVGGLYEELGRRLVLVFIVAEEAELGAARKALLCLCPSSSANVSKEGLHGGAFSLSRSCSEPFEGERWDLQPW
jgi:hypothetical protein